MSEPQASSPQEREPIAPPREPLREGKVVLRLPAPLDVDALVEFGDDPDVAQTIWLPIPSPCSRDVAHERVSEFRRGWASSSRFGPTMVIADAATNHMIGVAFLHKRDSKTVELSYGVAPNSRGGGVAAQAIRILSRWCLETGRCERVELRIDASNVASRRTAENAGFARRGTVRTTVPGTGMEYEDFLFVMEGR
jgi:RimJ/RimL family protein N-acetyltransferase